MLTSVMAILCAGIAGYLVPADDIAGRRLGELLGDTDTDGPGKSKRSRLLVSLLAGVVCAVLLGGVWGLVVGAVAAFACARVLSRLEPREIRRRRARLIADLPLAVDLLAACLRGGGAWHESVDAVAEAVDGPLGSELAQVAAHIRLGADPAQEWLRLTAQPELAALGRTAARATAGGAPMATTLARLARDQRRTVRTRTAAQAQTAGVRAVAPLGLCFLPAFILLGIIPAIAGIAAHIALP